MSLTACIDDRCKRQNHYQDRQHAANVAGVVVGRLQADSGVHVRVKAVANGRLLFSGSTTPRTQKFQPNGPGCPPTVWDVKLKAHKDGRLTAA